MANPMYWEGKEKNGNGGLNRDKDVMVGTWLYVLMGKRQPVCLPRNMPCYVSAMEPSSETCIQEICCGNRGG